MFHLSCAFVIYISELSILWNSRAILLQSLNTLVVPCYFWGLFKFSHFRNSVVEGSNTEKPLSEWPQTACKSNLKVKIAYFDLEFTIFLFHLLTMVLILIEAQLLTSIFVKKYISKRELAKLLEAIYSTAKDQHESKFDDKSHRNRFR